MPENAVRWGVLSTARIAATTFLPALREAGRGRAVLVAGRDAGRAAEFATANGVERSVEGYAAALADPEVDAIYVAMPNALHAQWATAALRAGKPVFCEKPLCISAAETLDVLEVAAEAGQPLWEGFVFAFQPQLARVRELIAGGAIGTPREVQAQFHAPLDDAADIRFSGELGGGVVADLACYPIHLARLVFGTDDAPAEATAARAARVLGTGGVEVETWGSVDFTDDRRLLFSASFRGRLDAAARILGTEGVIEIDHPYAARPVDTIRVHTDSGTTLERYGTDELPFADIIRHVHGVLLDGAAPRHLALTDSFGTAAILDAVRAAGSDRGVAVRQQPS
ncbi:MAG: Gfo/Idh/MocA family protein [Mycobacteriales bacterium]